MATQSTGSLNYSTNIIQMKRLTAMTTPSAMPTMALVLLLVGFTASCASAATFTITNQCPSTLYPAAIHGNGDSSQGTELAPGETWTLTVPVGASGRIWPRTGCSFDPVTGRGGCDTGDCGGDLRCVHPGDPPATLAEFNLRNTSDMYDISVMEGFNVPVDFSCSTCGIDGVIRCRDPGCPDANHNPGDGKFRKCQDDSDYEVVFCPSS